MKTYSFLFVANPAYAIEARYISDIAVGIRRDGFTIEGGRQA